MVGGYLSGLLFSCSRQRNRKAAKKGRRKKSRTRRGASQVQKKRAGLLSEFRGWQRTLEKLLARRVAIKCQSIFAIGPPYARPSRLDRDRFDPTPFLRAWPPVSRQPSAYASIPLDRLDSGRPHRRPDAGPDQIGQVVRLASTKGALSTSSWTAAATSRDTFPDKDRLPAMPRRKIGADLKEALCKLYEAGDISADTIEKHGIMSRATFFRNLKMYKSGASLEQRHSTGRKTNADKLKEQDKLELDALRPSHLSHLELVLLLDEDDKGLQEGSARNKRKAKANATSSKRRDLGKSAAGEASRSEGTAIRDESGSESDGDSDDAAILAKHQALAKLRQAARSFLAADGVASSSRGVDQSTMDDRSGINDLDSLLKPEDSHYSHVNRGALFIVRPKGEVREDGPTGGIIAAIALRSLIWTPEIYQALGPSYAGRSIDRICNLVHLRVDARWQRRGIGRWLVNVAGLKAAKLGFPTSTRKATPVEANCSRSGNLRASPNLLDSTTLPGSSRLLRLQRCQRTRNLSRRSRPGEQHMQLWLLHLLHLLAGQ